MQGRRWSLLSSTKQPESDELPCLSLVGRKQGPSLEEAVQAFCFFHMCYAGIF